MSTKRRNISDEPSALKKAAAPSAPELKKEKKLKDKSKDKSTTKKAEKTEKKQDAPEPTEQSTEEDSATLDNAPEQEEEVETVKKSFKDLVCLLVNPVHVNATKVLTDILHRELSTPSAKLANVSDTRTRPPFKNSRFP